MIRFIASAMLLVCFAGSASAKPGPYLEGCSVTATGWVHSEELGSFQATITVTGPCDASLADMMRQAIADLRAGFK